MKMVVNVKKTTINYNLNLFLRLSVLINRVTSGLRNEMIKYSIYYEQFNLYLVPLPEIYTIPSLRRYLPIVILQFCISGIFHLPGCCEHNII